MKNQIQNKVNRLKDGLAVLQSQFKDEMNNKRLIVFLNQNQMMNQVYQRLFKIKIQTQTQL